MRRKVNSQRARHYLAGSREFLAFPEYYQPETALSRGIEGRADRANPYARTDYL